jgi:hydrogenase expression/formation protein HypE
MPNKNPPDKILLGHGSGGRLMHELIENLLLPKLHNPLLNKLADSALLEFKGKRLAFTTDSFVVSPLFFKGGDIGKLAVCGTVNDLVMLGATPRFISLALILEEGLDYRILEKIIDSIAINAKKENVVIATGDLKVVEKNACDKIFINTSGIGEISKGPCLSVECIEPGDKIIVTGRIAEHGLSVLSGRKAVEFDFDIKSDCCALSGLLLPVVKNINTIKFMRDPTRGGVATTLNEIAQNSNLGVVIKEKNIPISLKARAACELLGIDPLYVANEGKAILIVSPEDAEKTVNLLRRHSLGRYAKIIGTIVKNHKKCVLLNTILGTQRIVDMLADEPLPRIC